MWKHAVRHRPAVRTGPREVPKRVLAQAPVRSSPVVHAHADWVGGTATTRRDKTRMVELGARNRGASSALSLHTRR